MNFPKFLRAKHKQARIVVLTGHVVAKSCQKIRHQGVPRGPDGLSERLRADQ